MTCADVLDFVYITFDTLLLSGRLDEARALLFAILESDAPESLKLSAQIACYPWRAPLRLTSPRNQP